MGGHEAAQKIWREYFVVVDAILFVVDAADQMRLPEARKCLHVRFFFSGK